MIEGDEPIENRLLVGRPARAWNLGQAVRSGIVANALRMGSALRTAKPSAFGKWLEASAQGDGAAYLEEGWHAPEAWGSWGAGGAHKLQLIFSEPPDHDIELDAEVEVLLDGVSEVQQVDVVVSGQRLTTWEFTSKQNRAVRTVRIPKEATSSQGDLTVISVEFSPHSAVTPQQLDPLTRDSRLLGLGLCRFRQRMAATPIGKWLEASAQGDGAAYLQEGWHAPEAWGSWGAGGAHKLQLIFSEPPDHDIELDAEVEVLLDGVSEVQQVDVVVSGQRLTTWEFTSKQNRAVRTVRIPKEATSSQGDLTVISVEFSPHSAVTPQQLDPLTRDSRLLGLGLCRFRQRVAGTPFGERMAATPIGKWLEASAQGDGAAYLQEGWHAPEAWGSWGAGGAHKLQLIFSEPPDHDIELDAEVEVLLDGVSEVQQVDVVVSGQRLTTWEFTSKQNRAVRTARIPKEAARLQGDLAIGTVEFSPHSAVTPQQLDPLTRDSRLLGLGLCRFRQRVAGTPFGERVAATPIGKWLEASAQGDGAAYLQEGWHAPEAWGAWGAGGAHKLQLIFSEPPDHDIELDAEVEVLLDGVSEVQQVDVVVSGQRLTTWEFTSKQNRAVRTARIPKEAARLQGDLAIGTVEFSPHSAVTPQQLDPLTRDSRLLGLGLCRFRQRVAGTPFGERVAATPIGKWLEASAQGDGAAYLQEGWHAPEAWGAWGAGGAHKLQLIFSEPPDHDIELDAQVEVLLDGVSEVQQVDVVVSGQRLTTWEFTSKQNRAVRTVRIPKQATSSQGDLTVISVKFSPHSAVTPQQLDPLTQDSRLLGLGLCRFRQRVAATPFGERVAATPIGKWLEASAQGDGAAYLQEGWHAPEAWGAWGAGGAHKLQLIFSEPPDHDIELDAEVEVLLDGVSEVQQVDVVVSGQRLTTWEFTSKQNRAVRTVRIPKQATSSQGDLTVISVKFSPHSAVTPQQLDPLTQDSRLLGLGLCRFRQRQIKGQASLGSRARRMIRRALNY